MNLKAAGEPVSNAFSAAGFLTSAPEAASSGSQPSFSHSHRRPNAAYHLPTNSHEPCQRHHPWAAHPSHTALDPAAASYLFAPLQRSSSSKRLLLSGQGALPLHYRSSSSSSSNRWLFCKLTRLLNLSLNPKPYSSMSAPAAGSALTVRAVAAGLLVGAVLCFSNMYFGLQTGWVTMGSLQSAILGYGVFQGLGAANLITRHLTVAENVIVQTTAVATATMPLAAGLVGIIPALGLLTPEEHPSGAIKFTPWELLGWCFSLAFFGVFVAVPLRFQTIIREKLRFPSGTATASVIRTLHGVEQDAGMDAGSSSTESGTAAGQGHSSSSTQQQQQQQQGLLGSAAALDLRSSKVDLEVAVDPVSEAEEGLLHTEFAAPKAQQQQQQWARALHLLLWVFGVSGAYCLVAAWVKALSVLPVFDWLGLPAATAWGWVLQPSPGYIGQGMIMGPRTAWSMMAGAVTGWAILGPKVKAWGWAPGPIKNVETGAAGWLMWLSLGVLLGDCFSELGMLILQTAWDKAQQAGWVQRGLKGLGFKPQGLQGTRSQGSGLRAGYVQLEQDAEQGLNRSASVVELSPSDSSNGLQDGTADGQYDGSGCVAGSSDNSRCNRTEQHQDTAPLGASGGDAGRSTPAAAAAVAADGGGVPDLEHDHGSARDSEGWLLSPKFWLPGLVLSTGLCTAILGPLLKMPLHEPLIAVLVALLVALLAVRALGQTDLNPVSGVGKISQLVFAVVSPGAVVPNLVAGAIAEAGAQQAGDLMQDFKTAHLLGVPPSSQLVAMLLGSAASVPLSVAAYMLYTNAWQVPGPVLPAPTAMIWLDMAKLVNGGKLPEHVAPFCAAAAAIAAALPVLQHALQRLQQQQQPRRPPPSAHEFRKSSEDGAEAAVMSVGSSYTASKEGGKGAGIAAAWRRLLLTWRSRSAVDWCLAALPSGVGFAVGMYLTPNWTLPRLIGSVEQIWLLLSPGSHAAFMMVTASGLVLGEGCASVITAVLHAVMA